ncbi:DNA mismatch repair protein MutS [Flavobacteriales bacterium]|nr:DNA mismatch repair protein MutS [Flavobacteriales bacterium]
MFHRKRKAQSRLLAQFGKQKDDSFRFEWIEKYFRRKDNSQSFQVLSDKTCNDLDFEELFMFLDRTNSSVGQQFLYNKLRIIPSNSSGLGRDEELIALFSTDQQLRLQVQIELEKLNKFQAFYISSLFQEEHIKPPKWFFMVRLLSFTSLLSIIMIFFNPQFVLALVLVMVVNVGFHYWNKKNLYQYLGSIPQLLILNDVARRLNSIPQLNGLNPDLSGSIKIIDKVKLRMSFFRLEAKLQGDFEAIFWSVLEMFKTVFLLEPLLLFGVLNKLNRKRSEIGNVFSFVGYLDAMISIASLRSGLKLSCFPEIADGSTGIKADQIYHPFIPNCVTNNITVSDRSVLLTGSNMSGKTSFIRAVGLNVITGLTINTCFAKTISIPRTRVFSAIRISDDLVNNKSYYFEEVLTIKTMIDQIEGGKRSLFLLDEIFKGTNTVERISAGKAVLSALSKKPNLVFVSTHDIELADLLKEEYDLYHFSEIVNSQNVAFDYKLKNGKLKNRNAIRILEINDYPKELISEALEITKLFDKKGEGLTNPF